MTDEVTEKRQAPKTINHARNIGILFGVPAAGYGLLLLVGIGQCFERDGELIRNGLSFQCKMDFSQR